MTKVKEGIKIKNFIIDGHIDTVLNLEKDNYDFSTYNPSFHVDLPRLKKAGVGIEIFALYVEEKFKPHFAVERTIQLIDRFYQIFAKNNEMLLIKNYQDINKVRDNNKIGAILAIEGGEGIFDLCALRTFYRLGVRLITLTWNNRNHIADGVNEAGTGGGLTNYGKKLVKKMNEIGMIVDLSHISPTGFWDVINICKQSPVASHSNARAICDVPRNLSDKQIIALAKKRSIIGINFCPDFLNKSGKAEIKDVIKHINYIKNLVGIEYIGLGTDYDGIINTPSGLEDISYLPVLAEELLTNGFSKTEIKMIFQENWLRIFREVMGES